MMIEVKNLFYAYPDKLALNNISFSIGEGAITALVGPNGAGKTTLLRCLAALSKPLSGEIFINGCNAINQPREVHRQLGYLSDFFGLYDNLSVRKALQFIAYSRIEDDQVINSAINIAADRADVSEFIDKKISTLSRGMRQRVGIAQAIIHNPKVLLLDEPASGLDPEARYSLATLLRQLRDAGMVIIVSSHILAELEDYSNDLIVMQDGKVIEHKALSSVLAQLKNMLLKFDASPAEYIENIKNWPGIQNVIADNNEIRLQLDESELPRNELLKKLIMSNYPVLEIAEEKVNLQEEYIKTVQKSKKG